MLLDSSSEMDVEPGELFTLLSVGQQFALSFEFFVRLHVLTKQYWRCSQFYAKSIYMKRPKNIKTITIKAIKAIKIKKSNHVCPQSNIHQSQ